MRSENRQTAIDLINIFLEGAKIESMRKIYTRLEPWTDGKIRTLLTPTTETGRLASSGRDKKKWPRWEYSTNLQNLPKKTAKADPLYNVRQCLIPSKGCVLVEADLSQAEVYATAAYAGDWEKIERLVSGVDEHKRIASAIYDTPIEEITDSQRHLGKMSNHAMNYGIGWRMFMRKVNKDADLTGIAISAKEAKAASEAFKRLNPKTVEWWRETEQKIRKYGYLINAFGRRRDFLNRDDLNEALAYLPQSTIADHLNAGLVRVYHNLHKRNRCTLLLQIHDAVLVEAQYPLWREVAREMKELLYQPFVVDGREVKVPVDVSMSTISWGDMNEAGL